MLLVAVELRESVFGKRLSAEVETLSGGDRAPKPPHWPTTYNLILVTLCCTLSTADVEHGATEWAQKRD